VGLLSLGKSDFEAIEPFRGDRFFREALGLSKVPSSAWMRQRLNAKGDELRELTDELSLRLIERTEAPISTHEGYVCCDIDTFVMDNSNSKKELVGRTYQGIDGYTPIAAYLGNEGWNIGLELRAGTQHSAFETNYFLERVLERLERLCATHHRVLMRQDSGFDSVQLLFMQAAEKERWSAMGRSFDFIVKWNPRRQDKAAWAARADAADAWVQSRLGKRVAVLSLDVERAWKKTKRTLRLIVQVTERTIDKKGQHLLAPEIELQGWWTSLDVAEQTVIDLYKHHGMHEQFHSEIKSDLDLERLPSGKFDTNDCLLHLASFAYNCLRLLGQVGLTGEIAPIRHPAKRRRIKTVLQEIMYRAAKFVMHARRLILDFGRAITTHAQVFILLQERLLKAAGP
jgi:hypothetical protein